MSGTVYVRTTITGPVTTASLQVADKEPVTGTGTGAFTGNEVTLVAGPYAATDLIGDGPHVDVTVSAGAATRTLAPMTTSRTRSTSTWTSPCTTVVPG